MTEQEAKDVKSLLVQCRESLVHIDDFIKHHQERLGYFNAQRPRALIEIGRLARRLSQHEDT